MNHIPMKSLCLLLCALMLGACSASPPTADSSNPVAAEPPARLPAPLALEGIATKQRSAAGDNLQLLSLDFILASDEGATPQPGSLVLTPPEGGTAWAVYAAAGLQPGGEVVPSSLLTIFNKPVYIAVADFSSNRWQWVRRGSVGSMLLDDGASLVSPGGRVYVAALAWQQEVVLSSLQLNFSGTVPASPTAVANAPVQVTSGYPMQYSAAGSTAGSGALVTAVTYDFGDGSGKQVTDDPLLPVEHTYAAPGSYEFTVTIDNDLGYSATDSILLEVTEGFTELLVVANSDDPDSMELADYYMSPLTGRGIASTHLFELALGENPDPAIARADYETQIRDPLRQFLEGEFSDRLPSLKYILLMDAIPHQIPGTNGGDYNLSSYSAVDSELCTIFSDGSYAHESFLWNEEDWQDFRTTGTNDASFYIGLDDLDTDYSFSRGQFLVTDGDDMQYPLDFLVGRLDAYDLADAKALVDRSLAADTSGNGWVVYDTTPSRFPLDTMTDPVWPLTGDEGDSGAEEMAAAGQNYFIDLTTTRVIGQESDGMPAGSVGNVIAYAGWGVNHSGGSWPSGNQYILDDLLFTYLPGAAWISYESFNGTDFDSATVDGDRSDIDRRGQGQICDFLHRGGSVAIGHVYEPWTIAVGDERAVFYRYAVKGDRWIEAAYKGLRCLSWMDVVVGDPLCRVRE